MAPEEDFARVKGLLGDTYEPRLDDMIWLLVAMNELRPTGISERVRVGRMKLAVLDRLGLSRVAKSEQDAPEEDADPIRVDPEDDF